jgi:hypothetical protein
VIAAYRINHLSGAKAKIGRTQYMVNAYAVPRGIFGVVYAATYLIDSIALG